jgi:hypothetical protein
MTSLFSPLSNGKLPFVPSSTNEQMKNFRLYDEQTINRYGKNFWTSVFRLKRQYICTYVYYLYVYVYVCVYGSVYAYVYLNVFVYVNIYICVCVYIYIYSIYSSVFRTYISHRRKTKWNFFSLVCKR